MHDHIASFAAYNVLIGYLLVRRETPGTVRLALFITAMTLHFVVNDYGLREQHKNAFERKGRWVLATAVWAGLALGAVTEVHRVVLAVLLGFLAGGAALLLYAT